MKRPQLTWRTTHDVVTAVELQTAAAASLAGIAGQDRLSDPRTNPAVRGHADKLRDEQHTKLLDAEHDRKLRSHRVYGRRAESAERALEAVQAARESSSPARSVLSLHQGRTRFMAASLAASLTLSAASAIGVAALAVKLDAPAEIGYYAEVGMTGLTTTVILYRSHLAQHSDKLDDWRDKVLWALMICPLLASMAANAYGTGVIGVACSVGAAAFSLLSYVIADASADALRGQAEKVSETDEKGLRDIATGDTLAVSPSSPTPQPENPRRSDQPAISGRRLSLTYATARPVTTTLPTKAIRASGGHFAKTIMTAPRVTTVTAPSGSQRAGDRETPLTGQPAPARVTEPTIDHPVTTTLINDHPLGHEDVQHLPGLTDHLADQVNDQPTPVTTPVVDQPEAQVTTPTMTAPPAGHQTKAAPVNRKKRGADADQNARAIKAYRDSVTAGQPLSQRELAAMFKRSSGWGHARIKEAGLTVVGQPVTVVSDHHDDDQASDDQASDESDRLGSAAVR